MASYALKGHETDRRSMQCSMQLPYTDVPVQVDEMRGFTAGFVVEEPKLVGRFGVLPVGRCQSDGFENFVASQLLPGDQTESNKTT